MNPTQTTFTASDDPNETDDSATDGDTPPSNNVRTATSASSSQTTLAPPDQRGGEHCCPWCLAAPETFEHREDGHARCGYCDAAIPIGADWFERDEKIALRTTKSEDCDNRT